MSFQAMTWATAQTCGSPTTKLVLLMLANHANGHTGQCNPRHRTLAAECEIRIETLKEHLKRLADSGLIEIVPQFAEGVQLPNQYRLNMQGGGGEIHTGGGGEIRTGGGGEIRPPNNQESNQEENQVPASRGTTLRIWLEDVKTKGEQAIPETDPVFAYAEKTGIPDEFLRLAWRVFKDQHTSGAGSLKRQKSWRQTFRTYVEKGYMRLWYINAEGQYALTTAGIQAQRAHEVSA